MTWLNISDIPHLHKLYNDAASKTQGGYLQQSDYTRVVLYSIKTPLN